ncbi:Aste57867_20235 [Aphanomyces stellatus]|uniref:Aste57867_20235 protein n=1 Tax=Aphanomyces stellatus TaxID=120398 RepID=A0A485LEN4_9STRA|nr:hypothetical protein As57867_020169 [Aphanomyces stellatus]VFT96926.1 Aste57867_20235 [Aphanomyces stellatus]
MTLSHSNGSYHFASQSTFQMYWGLASDLWAVSQNTTLIGGQSLIRTSGSYAFANKSMFTLLAQNGTVVTPLGAAFTLVQSTIGPFGSIDMRNIPCPASVKQFVTAGLDILVRTLAGSATAALLYGSVSENVLGNLIVLPSNYMAVHGWGVFGGNILCPEMSDAGYVENGMATLTDGTSACGQSSIVSLQMTKPHVMLAVVAVWLSLPNQSVSAVCAHETSPMGCATNYMGPSTSFVQDHISPSDIHALETLATVAVADVSSIGATIFQYVQMDSTSPLEMLEYVVFDPADPTFFFWAWQYVLQWAVGHRQVVRFEGDVGFIHLVTEVKEAMQQDILAHEFLTTLASYICSSVQYITGVMLAITIAIALYILSSRGSVEASNLMKMNRVAGIVWVGRPLLLLRGVTALALLSTGTLELQIKHGCLSYFSVVDVPWYKTILAAGETTWLVYITNDLLMIWTKQYTSLYASNSGVLTWFVAAVLSLTMPVVHHATVNPICHIYQMDFQLVCASGVAAIGQITRFYWLLGIIASSNLVCYVVARLYYQGLGNIVDTPKCHSRLLSAGAKYFFTRSNWLYHNVYYMDPASALMNGLVSFPWCQWTYIFDIKLWRILVVERSIQDNIPSELRTALALNE